MPTQFVTSSDGARIAYDVSGAGPPLLLLHGSGKTRQDWHKAGYVDRLASDFTTIAMDLRGSGESEFLTHPADYAIDRICADIYAVADACSAAHFAVWGYSYGGNIARYLGAWSERPTAIVIIGAPFGAAVDAEFDRQIDEFASKYGPMAQAYGDGSLSETQRRTAVKGSIPALLACFEAMRSWPAIAANDIRCPILLVAGTQNKRMMTWLNANAVALDSAGIELAVIDGLNHAQEFSRIDQVYPAVHAFLKRHGGPETA